MVVMPIAVMPIVYMYNMNILVHIVICMLIHIVFFREAWGFCVF